MQLRVLSENGIISRGGSRTAATSKIEPFVIIVNDWKPLFKFTSIFVFIMIFTDMVIISLAGIS